MSVLPTRKSLNTPEAAKYLTDRGTKYTRGTLEVWRSQGRGPRYRKVGRNVFYAPGDLDRFAEGQVVETIDSRQA